jgi:hypothetical protein
MKNVFKISQIAFLIIGFAIALWPVTAKEHQAVKGEDYYTMSIWAKYIYGIVSGGVMAGVITSSYNFLVKPKVILTFWDKVLAGVIGGIICASVYVF